MILLYIPTFQYKYIVITQFYIRKQKFVQNPDSTKDEFTSGTTDQKDAHKLQLESRKQSGSTLTGRTTGEPTTLQSKLDLL